MNLNNLTDRTHQGETTTIFITDNYSSLAGTILPVRDPNLHAVYFLCDYCNEGYYIHKETLLGLSKVLGIKNEYINSFSKTTFGRMYFCIKKEHENDSLS